MDSIAIIGVGLIGGSFGLALKQAGFTGRIYGVSSPGTIASALQRNAIDEGVTLETAAKQAEVLYLAQPINSILRTIERLAKLSLRSTQLVTDAGSTKVRICQHAMSLLPQTPFLGGHPMAGKEARGVAAADANLFEGRTYVICPEEKEFEHTLVTSAFLSWVERIGARPLFLSSEEHDRTVAFTSHLPQLLSTALALTLSDEGVKTEVSGPGLQDMTRLALSSYEIWQDILDTNSREVRHALGVYIDKLTEMRENIQTQRLDEVFSKASGIAKKIRR